MARGAAGHATDLATDTVAAAAADRAADGVAQSAAAQIARLANPAAGATADRPTGSGRPATDTDPSGAGAPVRGDAATEAASAPASALAGTAAGARIEGTAPPERPAPVASEIARARGTAPEAAIRGAADSAGGAAGGTAGAARGAAEPPAQAAITAPASAGERGPVDAAAGPRRTAPGTAIPSSTATDILPAAALMPGAPLIAAQAGDPVAVRAAVGSAPFAEEMASKLATLVRAGRQSAELTLHPASLGPIRVDVQLQGLQASIEIHASQPATREALQAALPLLHAQFEQGGLRLASAHIGDRMSGDGGTQGGSPERHGAPARQREADVPPTTGRAPRIDTAAPRPLRGDGLVDTFA